MLLDDTLRVALEPSVHMHVQINEVGLVEHLELVSHNRFCRRLMMRRQTVVALTCARRFP